MAAKIKLKKSSVSGKEPQVADLDHGELAVNYADGVLYYKNTNNNIASISGGGAEADSALWEFIASRRSLVGCYKR